VVIVKIVGDICQIPYIIYFFYQPSKNMVSFRTEFRKEHFKKDSEICEPTSDGFISSLMQLILRCQNVNSRASALANEGSEALSDRVHSVAKGLKKHQNTEVERWKILPENPSKEESIQIQKYFDAQDKMAESSALLGLEAADSLILPSNNHLEVVSFLKKKVSGLSNPGNHCYLHAVLQALISLQSSRELVNKPLEIHPEESEIDFQKRIATQKALRKFYIAYHNQSLNPRDLVKYVLELRNNLFATEPCIDFKNNPNGQKDASVFLEALLSVLDVNFSLQSRRKGISKLTGVPFDKEMPKDPMSVLQIEMKQGVSFQELLKAKTLEVVNDTSVNKWRLDMGEPVSEYDITTHIVGEPPEFLAVQLKRFGTNKAGIPHKISAPIDYPEDDIVDLRELTNTSEPVLYRTVGFVNHRGDLAFGHYTAYTKREDVWWYSSDSTVVQVESKKVDRKNAYLIFLEKI
jgi:ubiquitin C-terminal hydrolase